MLNPFLSIIIVVYNVEEFVSSAIESVLNQNFRDFELIIVNDGSKDKSAEICLNFKDPRIIFISQNNKGLSGARNTGIKVATGRYITFLDSDDTIAPDTYQLNVDIIKENPEIDILEFPIREFYGSPFERKLTFIDNTLKSEDSLFDLWIRNEGHIHNYACNKIFRRTLFSEIEFPEGKTFEDIYTIPEIVKKSHVFRFSSLGEYFYYKRDGSITTSLSLTSFYNLYYSAIEIYKIIDNNKKLLKQRDKYSLEIINFLINIARNEKRDKVSLLIKETPIKTISVVDLFNMPISMKLKIKNIPFALLGLKAHIFVYTNIIRK